MKNMQWEHYLMITWLYQKLFKTKEGGLEIVNIKRLILYGKTEYGQVLILGNRILNTWISFISKVYNT